MVKKRDALCYTRTLVTHIAAGPPAPASQPDITTQDPSGTTVATVHVDDNDVITVTCPGGAPTVLMQSCGFSDLTAKGAYLTQSPPPTCTGGACTLLVPGTGFAPATDGV